MVGDITCLVRNICHVNLSMRGCVMFYVRFSALYPPVFWGSTGTSVVLVVVVVYFLAVPVLVGRVGLAMAPLYFHRSTTAYVVSQKTPN
jgi:hypothetical protein